MKMNKRS